MGAVVSNVHGSLLAAGVRRDVVCWDVATLEAMDVRFSVGLAHRLGFTSIILEGNALGVVDAVHKKKIALAGWLLFFIFFMTLIMLRNVLILFLFLMLKERRMLLLIYLLVGIAILFYTIRMDIYFFFF